MAKLIAAIAVVVLLLGFIGCSVAAYQGYGLQSVGPYHLRTGSVRGPSVIGGGPSVGK